MGTQSGTELPRRCSARQSPRSRTHRGGTMRVHGAHRRVVTATSDLVLTRARLGRIGEALMSRTNSTNMSTLVADALTTSGKRQVVGHSRAQGASEESAQTAPRPTSTGARVPTSRAAAGGVVA